MFLLVHGRVVLAACVGSSSLAVQTLYFFNHPLGNVISSQAHLNFVILTLKSSSDKDSELPSYHEGDSGLPGVFAIDTRSWMLLGKHFSFHLLALLFSVAFWPDDSPPGSDVLTPKPMTSVTSAAGIGMFILLLWSIAVLAWRWRLSTADRRVQQPAISDVVVAQHPRGACVDKYVHVI